MVAGLQSCCSSEMECAGYNSCACLQDSFSILPCPAPCPRRLTPSNERVGGESDEDLCLPSLLRSCVSVGSCEFHTSGSAQVAHLSCSSSHQAPIPTFLPLAPLALGDIMASCWCRTQNPLFISSPCPQLSR